MDSERASSPNIDGVYRFPWDGKPLGLITFKGTEATFAGFHSDNESLVEITFGSFDEVVDKRGLEATGLDKYSVKLGVKALGWTLHANICEDGKVWILENGQRMELMTEDDLEMIKNAFDDADNYSHFYELNPGEGGKIIWITGATGMGKSKTAENLAKETRYVLYDGDAFMYGSNPLTANSPKGYSVYGTRHLKNIPPERVAAKDEMVKSYYKIFEGESSPLESWTTFNSFMCDDIIKLKAQIGGNFIVPHATYTREVRDFIRNKLGPDCIFVCLNMSLDLHIRRLAVKIVGISANDDVMEQKMEEYRTKNVKVTKGYQPMEPDEPNTFEVYLTPDTNENDVVKYIIEKLKSYV